MPIIACGARLCRHPIGQYAPHTAPEIAFWDAGLTLDCEAQLGPSSLTTLEVLCVR